MDRDKIICRCLGISVGDIEDSVKNGANTFEEVQEETGCATGCGRCKSEIVELVNELVK